MSVSGNWQLTNCCSLDITHFPLLSLQEYRIGLLLPIRIPGTYVLYPSTLLFLSPIWDKEKRGGRER
jgi:hypothetical protein